MFAGLKRSGLEILRRFPLIGYTHCKKKILVNLPVNTCSKGISLGGEKENRILIADRGTVVFR